MSQTHHHIHVSEFLDVGWDMRERLENARHDHGEVALGGHYTMQEVLGCRLNGRICRWEDRNLNACICLWSSIR